MSMVLSIDIVEATPERIVSLAPQIALEPAPGIQVFELVATIGIIGADIITQKEKLTPKSKMM